MVLQMWKKKYTMILMRHSNSLKKKRKGKKTNIVISKTWSFGEGSAVVPEDFFVVSL